MSEFPAPGDKSKSWLPEPGEGQEQKSRSKSWLPDPNDPRQLYTGTNYGRGLFRVWVVIAVIWSVVVAFWWMRNDGGANTSLFAHLVLYACLPAAALALIGWIAFPVLRWVRRGFSSGA